MNTNNFRGFDKASLAGLILLSTTFLSFGEPAAKDLVLYFPLGSIGQGRIKDFSSQHNNGTPSGIVVSNSRSLVSMQDTRQITLAVWIKPRSIAYGFPVLVSKGGNEPGGAYGGYELLLNGNGDNDLLFVSGGYAVDTHGAQGKWINNHLGEWIHVAFTTDDRMKTAKFYVNGQPTNDELNYGTSDAINFDLPNNLYVGVPDPASNPNRLKFDGAMSALKIFNRALSAKEIQALYQKTNPSQSKKL